MRSIGEAEFDGLLRSFEHSSDHLETRDAYGTAVELPYMAKWATGEPDDLAWLQDWCRTVQAHVAAGQVVRRARIVSEPLSDYQRWSYSIAYPMVEAGEDIRWVPRRLVSSVAVPGNDFYLFDDRLVVFLLYAGSGLATDRVASTDPADILLCRSAFSAVWQLADLTANINLSTTTGKPGVPLISAQERDALLAGATQELRHLELRDVYGLAGEAPQFAKFRATGQRDHVAEAPGRQRWNDLIRGVRSQGCRVRRARIVSEPVTDYIRYEYAGTGPIVDAGEEVRWLPRRLASSLALPGNDFWLVDDVAVIFTAFTGDGEVAERQLVSDAAAIELCRSAFEAVWPLAVPHDQYRPRWPAQLSRPAKRSVRGFGISGEMPG